MINSVYGPDGNRMAEFDFDPVANTSTLIREYVWFEGNPIAVVEGGVVYYVRSDHIGKPVFATDATGAKVWEATYLPFGGVHTNSGTNINLRFPGQWFQSESGLHQNWMRDYDPTTGRYFQADPLGLVDGPSVYGYAKQNPGRYIDPTGEAVAAACLVPGISGVCAKVALMCVEGAVIITGMILQSRAADTECSSCSTAPPPPPRDECITQCTALALPTSDYGVSFFRCMNACTSNGNSGFPEWDKHFP